MILKQKYIKTQNFGIKKREQSLCVWRGPTRKCPINHCHQLHRINHGNFVKLRRTIENTTGFQSDPSGKVINLSKERFTKETFKLLNKNLNFIPTQTNFSKTTLNKELEDFYRRIKLKVHFKNAKNKDQFTEEDIQKTYKQNLSSK